MTIKYKTIYDNMEDMPAAYSTYPNGGVYFFTDIFVVNQTLVFKIKFCGKNPPLRQAPNR
ncbi:MAG: hypothetical protein QM535_17335 [Limnohabitans sp.]|nr:hypothetical protein [Limnohabitans sp.]